ncbi:unnamed protein product [Prunus armeniaca]|uniref:Uncharacterized protein n=1 Tax=Prunus armeniaca TaxID=36596 RepID=A0A6J5TPY4_PRUAR|nr:unnamed protein product [Prunus armeniaca]
MAECSDQNIKNPQPEEEEEYAAVVGKHLSMLCLDNSSSSSSFKSPNSSPKPRRTLKRRSPSQSPPISQPNPKKEKLDLPPNPLLRRCSSERFNPTSPPPPPPFYSFNSHHNQLQCPNAASPASASTDKASGAAAVSAYASTLRRSVSNPKPSSCSPALKTISRQSSSSSSGDEDDDDDATPNSKRLRRIKDRVREMSLWFQQVMRENEDDEEEEEEEVEREPPQEQHHQQNGDTTELQVGSDINFAESVSVERMGDGLVIHFRCHCGVPYQFLLAGGNCYYKLMAFSHSRETLRGGGGLKLKWHWYNIIHFAKQKSCALRIK